MAQATDIPGYDYGRVGPSPLTLDDLRGLQAAVAFDDEDGRYLRLAGEVLADQVEQILDVWYGFVGSQPHLLHYFCGPDGQPDARYLEAVRRRFAQWILDTCLRPYDQQWLDYQHEIALRHHRSKKNLTDGVQAPAIVPARYLVALIYPIVATIRPFLAKKGHSPEVVDRMWHAWFKAVVLQVALWCYPYVREGDY
ncbi:MAG TPA: protoglobin domain-containing protein [Dehalococcoidia bacterium]|nr:protoglobin domain-containing protein [Dehalococcoidia bacterium]